MTQQATPDELREMANWLEDHPEVQRQAEAGSYHKQGIKDTVFTMALAKYGDKERALEFHNTYAERIDAAAAGRHDPDLFPEIVAKLGGGTATHRSVPAGGPDLHHKRPGGSGRPSYAERVLSGERISPEERDAESARYFS